MFAVILAGGRGTRLRPYTTTIPKPLVPVGDRAILEVVLSQLRDAGFDRVRIAVSHMAELIMAFFGHGEKFGLTVDYAIEDEPLGTVGPLRGMDDLPDDFLLMNGDILTDLDCGEMLRDHVRRKALLTVSTYRRRETIDFGVLEVNGDTGRVVGFREKPHYDFDVSMGIYAVNRAILERIPENRAYGFDDLVLDLLARGDAIHARPFDGYWLDLGRPDDYDRANREIDALLPRRRPDEQTKR